MNQHVQAGCQCPVIGNLHNHTAKVWCHKVHPITYISGALPQLMPLYTLLVGAVIGTLCVFRLFHRKGHLISSLYGTMCVFITINFISCRDL